MRIVIIGSGNLATQLSLALHDAGQDIVQVFSRTADHAKCLADKLGCTYTSDINAISPDADIYIISVKDDAIAEVAQAVGQSSPNALILHTAGSVAMSVLGSCASRYGVLYPMQTFSKERKLEFADIPIFIEADNEETLAVVRQLADSVSRKVVTLSSEDRRYLHLSAVFACNFVNHCYDLAGTLLQQHGIPFDTLLPLIDETAYKVHELSPREAQTGPAVRYDKEVISRQSQMLEGLPKEIYELMSKSIHEIQ